VAKAAGNSYSPHLQLPHQGSTLQVSIFMDRDQTLILDYQPSL
jgi:hypothetical protein